MSMLNIFSVAGSAVSAQSQRLNTVATNLANADTVAGPDGRAYQARQVVFQAELMGALDTAGVRVAAVTEDATNGWTYDVATNQVTFHGSSCMSLQSSSAKLTIVYGCPVGPIG